MADRTLHNLILRIARAETKRALQRPGLARPLPNVSPSRFPGLSATSPADTLDSTARLISGGQVRATDPPSFNVIQGPLKGVSYGANVNNTQEITIEIPVRQGVGYLIVHESGAVQYTYNYPTTNELCTAAIHIPYEDTYEIRDEPSEDPDDHSGWIEPFNDGYWTGSIDANDPALLNAIREIAAEGLIGNLVLSETLKIINAAGSIVMDSQSIQIFGGGGGLRALFDEDSVDFFDEDGIQTATFGGVQARVGNILLNPNDLRSANWTAGVSGFIIRADGTVEFNGLTGSFSGTFVGHTVINNENPTTIIHGNDIFFSGRRSHMISNLTVTHKDKLFFGSSFALSWFYRGSSSNSNQFPDFQEQPKIVIIERSVPVWDAAMTTGSTWIRQLEAVPFHSSTSTDINSMVFHMRFLAAGSDEDLVATNGNALSAGRYQLAPNDVTAKVGTGPNLTRESTDAFVDPQVITFFSAPPSKTADCVMIGLMGFVETDTGEMEDAVFRYVCRVHVGTNVNAGLGLGGTFVAEATKTIEFDVALNVDTNESWTFAWDGTQVVFLPEDGLTLSADKCIMLELISATQTSGLGSSYTGITADITHVVWRDLTVGIGMTNANIGVHFSQD